jgi:hypothetical protein
VKTVFTDEQKTTAVIAARNVASGPYINAGLSDSDVWGIIERGMAVLADETTAPTREDIAKILCPLGDGCKMIGEECAPCGYTFLADADAVLALFGGSR